MQKKIHPIRGLALFASCSAALAILFWLAQSEASTFRDAPLLLSLRLIYQPVALAIVLLLFIVISRRVFTFFYRRNRSTSSSLAAVGALAALTLTTLPLGQWHNWGSLFYEDWFWLCAFALAAAGLFGAALIHVLNTCHDSLYGIGHALRKRLGFLFDDQPNSNDIAFITAISLIALAASWLFNQWLLGGIPHIHDSVSQYFQAIIFSRGAFYAPAPAHPEFFERVYILMDEGRWYSIFPPGFPLALAAGVMAGVPSIVNPFCTALSALLVYCLGLKLATAPQARLAAFLFILSPFVLMMGAGYMNHSACLLWTLFFFNALLRAIDAPCFRRAGIWSAAAGLSFGLMVLTRPVTALAFGLVAFAWALTRRMPVKRVLALGTAFIIGGSPAAAFQFAYNANTTGSMWTSPYMKQYGDVPLGFGETGWGPGKIAPGIPNTVVHTPLRGLSNSLNNLNGLNLWMLGWPVADTLFAFALFLPGMRRRRSDWLCLAAALSQSASYALFYYQDFCFGPRFVFETVPFWLILSARGLVEGARLIMNTAKLDKETLIGSAAGLLASLFVIAALTVWPSKITLFADEYWGTRDEVYHSLTNEIDANENALVFVEYDYDYYAVFTLLDPWMDNGWIVALDRGEDENQRLIDAHPERSVYWLRLADTQQPGETITVLEPYPLIRQGDSE